MDANVRALHRMFRLEPDRQQTAVEEAFEAVQEAFVNNGFSVDENKEAEAEVFAAIYKYLLNVVEAA